MSSMRNAVQRRNHRERAQPQERAKWGLLEKPKDYKLRAADHKVKKRKIKALQQKASERNEDEFYFAMMSNQSQGGVKMAKRGSDNSGGGKVLSGEVVKLRRTQDAGYLRTVLQQTKKERERVEREVVSGNVGVRKDVPSLSGKRTVFGDDEENKAVLPSPKCSREDDTGGEWSSEEADEEDDGPENDRDVKNLNPQEQRKRKAHAARRKKLDALKDREHDLTLALSEVDTQRARMTGSIGGMNKNGVKFRIRQRKM